MSALRGVVMGGIYLNMSVTMETLSVVMAVHRLAELKLDLHVLEVLLQLLINALKFVVTVWHEEL